MSATPEIESVVREAFRAAGARDLDALRRLSLPGTDLSAVPPARPAPPDLAPQGADLQISVRGEMPDGTIVVHAYTAGTVHPTFLRRHEGRVLVDMRWWLPALGPPTEQAQAVRRFMWAMVSADAEALAHLCVPGADLGALVGPSPPAGEMAQYAHVCENLPVIHLAPGERYAWPAGGQRTVAPGDVGPDRALMLAYFEALWPMPLRRIEGRWRVDPRALVEAAAR